MDTYGTARLAVKDAESGTVALICEEVNHVDTGQGSMRADGPLLRRIRPFRHSAGELCF